MTKGNFNGVRVLALESRRAQEIAKLIANNGGEPLVVPSVRETPIESNEEALRFARNLDLGMFDMVIFLTGVGVRLLAEIVRGVYSSEHLAECLKKVSTVARGPKPVAALRELGVAATVTVPEPNTWHDLLVELDRRKAELPLKGKQIAIQEYGLPNKDLRAALEHRGAVVTSVSVYEWRLPDDLDPLRKAIASIIAGDVSVLLVTSSIQIRHLFKVAKDLDSEESLRKALKKTLIASIGPLTSEEIRHHGLEVNFEPSHPKMGFLVQETAVRSAQLAGPRSN